MNENENTLLTTLPEVAKIFKLYTCRRSLNLKTLKGERELLFNNMLRIMVKKQRAAKRNNIFSVKACTDQINGYQLQLKKIDEQITNSINRFMNSY